MISRASMSRFESCFLLLLFYFSFYGYMSLALDSGVVTCIQFVFYRFDTLLYVMADALICVRMYTYVLFGTLVKRHIQVLFHARGLMWIFLY